MTPLYRRTLRVLVISQILSGTGLAAGVTVGALLAQDMTGSTGSAGLPIALFTLGSAAASIVVGRISQRSGRRPGLALGYAVGAAGGAGIVLAAAINSVVLLFIALLFYGSGVATNLQARYAGADLAPAGHRGRAISTVLVATTFGAVIGPNLTSPMGDVATAIGIRPLAGPFILAAIAYAIAGVVVHLMLRPDPLLTAREAHDTGDESLAAGDSAEPVVSATLRLGVAAMVIVNLIMVGVMTMTPIHMRDHGHSLADAGLVISLHVAAMFLPSPLTGQAIDRIGRRPVIGAGIVTMLAAGALAAAAPADSMFLLTVALMLLGLGWNFGLLAGTALLTDAVPLERRAQTQGAADLAVSLSGAGAGLASGFVVASAGYAVLSLAGGALALLLLPVLVAERRRRPLPSST